MDIETRDDIKRLTETFYETAMKDELLGPIFVDVAHLNLDIHIPVITDFWDNVLFHSGAYKGGAFEPHRKLHHLAPLGAKEFDRWLELWDMAIASLFNGPTADRASTSAHRFAAVFQRRLASEGQSSIEQVSVQPQPKRSWTN